MGVWFVVGLLVLFRELIVSRVLVGPCGLPAQVLQTGLQIGFVGRFADWFVCVCWWFVVGKLQRAHGGCLGIESR